MARIADSYEAPTMGADPVQGSEEHPLPDENDLFPGFQAGLSMDEASARELKHSTRYRYLRGELPVSFEWFLKHPQFLRMLADDADNMTEEKWERWRELIGVRATAQKDRRGDSKR